MKLRFILVFLFIFCKSYAYSPQDYSPSIFIYPAAFFELTRDHSNMPESIRNFTIISITLGTLLTGVSHAIIIYYKHLKKTSNEQLEN